MDDLLEFSLLLEKVTGKKIGHDSLRFQSLLKFPPDGVRAIDSLQTCPAAPANSLGGIFKDGIAGETDRRVNEIAKGNEDIFEKGVGPLTDSILWHER
jgi:hypothetical protein